MAAIMDDFVDGAMDNDEVFPCKGCGEVGPPNPSISRDLSQLLGFGLFGDCANGRCFGRSSRKERPLN